ncbi:hypothetical protein [Streptosporangium carneum]|uniref:Uncharacterized protein n=1 Tax=Streptosporangium carneum TaxID=47481 RepID=A0A9W6MDL6_9ACTN|nr:hypothetical protein [Streptosporangium carneum]GLK10227.1 hypothetical protein GCM10017600_36330 [Streptosporangium carneum]
MILLLSTACTTGGPTLDEAAQVLAQDAKKLEHLYPATNKKVVDQTGTGGSDFASCAKNETALRSYQLSSDFGSEGRSSPAQRVESFSLLLLDEIKKNGYEMDRNASWARPGRVVSILRKQNPGITFIVLVQESQPNVEVIGKTDCLPGGR